MADTKAARFKHEQGNRHKDSVAAWMKENRAQKKAEQKDKDDLAREMEAIEKAARLSFKSDVESGAAKFNAPDGGGVLPGYGYGHGHGGYGGHLPGGGPAGGFPGYRPPPPKGGPPPPPPRPGGPPPPPARGDKASDSQLAEELAKEGIILKEDANGSAGADAAGQPVLWWEYKPAAVVKGEEEGQIQVKNEQENVGASSSKMR